jgi:hypothetical protein
VGFAIRRACNSWKQKRMKEGRTLHRRLFLRTSVGREDQKFVGQPEEEDHWKQMKWKNPLMKACGKCIENVRKKGTKHLWVDGNPRESLVRQETFPKNTIERRKPDIRGLINQEEDLRKGILLRGNHGGQVTESIPLRKGSFGKKS